MKLPLPSALRDAFALTRTGDLQAATRAIQDALRGATDHATATAADLPLVERVDDSVDTAARAAPITAPITAPAAPASRSTPSPPKAAKAATSAPSPTAAQQPGNPALPAMHRGTHAAVGLQREYRLFVPPNAPAGPRPMVVMLHGCQQDADDFAAGTAMNAAAAREGVYVLYPAQSSQANPQRCWNWFKHTHQARGKGEPAFIADLVRRIAGEHPIDAERVYAAGLSAGGAMAAILGAAYPDVFAAIGVHSGLPAGAAKDVASAFAAMKGGPQAAPQSTVPTIVFHGDADAVVSPVNGDAVIAAGARGAATVEKDSGTHAGRAFRRERHLDAQGRVVAEHWRVQGAGHAWSGGSSTGSYTDPKGPDASAELLRFFARHTRRPTVG